MCGFLVSMDSGISSERFAAAFDLILHRGPDQSLIRQLDGYRLGFQRLAIMDTSSAGMQPFEEADWILVCNGEIYNYEALKPLLAKTEYASGSDCEVLIPGIVDMGCAFFAKLDAEFALVAYNTVSGEAIAARDPIGIRPLFYGFHAGQISFASEAKALVDLCDEVYPFPPGHYYAQGEFVSYQDLYEERQPITQEREALEVIHDDLVAAVKKRLMSDVEVGFLLSGGLDSSLVCAIAQDLVNYPIETFAIGMSEDAIDLKYAKQVADKIGSRHHEILMTPESVIADLEEVIRLLETWDTTTIRASIGMAHLCREIHRQSDVKVLLTGEISDELFGYKYTDFAPTPLDFQEESIKRVRELYMYDVLRADRCISGFALEGRVPFGDLDFVRDVLRIDPVLKMNHQGMGKYLLRKAFEADDILPTSILWREKAAFSDAVGHSMVDYLKAYAAELYPDFSAEKASALYPHHTPKTAEQMLYRSLFEKYYPGQDHWIVDYWMPNRSWPGCDVDDPSARVLSNYGLSGV